MPRPPVSSGPSIVAAEPLRLIVVRHGATALTGKVYNGCGVGAADPALSEPSRRELLGLDCPPAVDRIAAATSPARRARQTIDELVANWRLEPRGDPEIVEALAEVDFGEWEGRSAAKVRAEDPQRWRDWLSDPTVSPPKGSALAERADALRGYLSRLQSSPLRTWLLVGHASTVRLVVAQVLRLPLTEVQRISVRPGGWCDVRIWADGGSCLDRLG
ncbi:MAG: alpha-ribazole phosphatase [Actinomycetota bacterium]|nr:alpha-ribazole phosphatase [Actinomycetota bacterium]